MNSSDPRPPVLYLSHDGLTDQLGQSQILPYLKGLARSFSITVVTFEKPGRYEMQKQRIEAICVEAGIFWNPLPYHRRPPIISTLYDLWRLRRSVRRLHAERQFRIVHARSYLVSLVALWMKNVFKVKFIFDMRGFWADERIEGGIWKLSNPLYRAVYRYFKRKETEFLSKADHIISLTYNARNEILSWRVCNVPITVIPTCVDLKLFDRSRILKGDQESIRLKLGIDASDFVVTYLGSTGTWYRLNDVVSFYSSAKRKIDHVKLLMVTNDAVPASISSQPGVIIIKGEREEVPLLLSLADISVCFITPSFSKKASAATKMAESWAIGLPVVTNKGWGDVEVLEKTFPIFFSDGTDEQNERVLTDLRSINRSRPATDMSQFDLANGVATIERIYLELLGRSRPQ